MVARLEKLEKRSGLQWEFRKLVSLNIFKSSFLLFVKFDIMSGRQICLTRSSDFVVHKVISQVPYQTAVRQLL